MQFAFGFGPPLVLDTAIQLGIFDALAEQPRTVEEVAKQVGASTRGVSAVLGVLAALEFASKDVDGRYSLTPESAEFLVRNKPSYFGTLLHHLVDRELPHWMRLLSIVRTGKPDHAVNQEASGAPFFEEFVEALFPLGYAAAQRLADELRVAETRQPISVLDLAAGSGVWSIAIAQKSPQVTVTAVDWPGVLPVTRRVAARFGLESRYRFVAGDLLDSPGPSPLILATRPT